MTSVTKLKLLFVNRSKLLSTENCRSMFYSAAVHIYVCVCVRCCSVKAVIAFVPTLNNGHVCVKAKDIAYNACTNLFQN